MSTEKDDAKEKSTSTEKDEAKEKPTNTEKAEAKEKPANTEKAEAKEKPASTEKAEAEKKSTPAEKSKTQEKPESTEKVETKAKPLEKMTVKDLKEMAKEMPEISGVHGMKKEELIVAIKKVKDIEEEPVKKTDSTVTDLKKKIKALKAERRAALEASDKKMATIYRRRISRLKKKTRRAAA